MKIQKNISAITIGGPIFIVFRPPERTSRGRARRGENGQWTRVVLYENTKIIKNSVQVCYAHTSYI